MEPYIKSSSPLRGDKKPKIEHKPGQPRILRRQKDEIASVRRALKKAARQEGKRHLVDEE
jgi:hypothetical protein